VLGHGFEEDIVGVLGIIIDLDDHLLHAANCDLFRSHARNRGLPVEAELVASLGPRLEGVLVQRDGERNISGPLGRLLGDHALWGAASHPSVGEDVCLYDHVVGWGAEAATSTLAFDETTTADDDISATSNRARLRIDLADRVGHKESVSSVTFIIVGFRPGVAVEGSLGH